MPKNPFRYFKTSREIIQLAVMMYVRFPLSLRNVEDLLLERGVGVGHEGVRLWVDRFGPVFAGKIRTRRASYMRQHTKWQWHLDEVFVSRRQAKPTSMASRNISGVQSIMRVKCLRAMSPRPATSRQRLGFLRKAMKRYGSPRKVITDRLRLHGAAMKEIGNKDRHIIHHSTFKSMRNAALSEWRQLLAG